MGRPPIPLDLHEFLTYDVEFGTTYLKYIADYLRYLGGIGLESLAW